MVPSPTVSEVVIPFLMVPSPTVREVIVRFQALSPFDGDRGVGSFPAVWGL